MPHEDLFNYTEIEIEKDDKIVFVNSGVNEDVFEIINSLSDTIAEMINISIIQDCETAEQILGALSVHLEEEGLVDSTDTDSMLPVMISDVLKITMNGSNVILVMVAPTYSEDDDDDEEDDEDTSSSEWD